MNNKKGFYMKRVWKASEWQSPTGKWHINDVSAIASGSADWIHPCNIMHMTPEEFAIWIEETFNAQDVKLTERILLFDFLTQAEARKYKNYINAAARREKYLIEIEK